MFGSGVTVEWFAARIRLESSCSCGCIAQLVAAAGAEGTVGPPVAAGDSGAADVGTGLADAGEDAAPPAAGAPTPREVTGLLRRHRVL